MVAKDSLLAFVGTFADSNVDGVFTFSVDTATGNLDGLCSVPGGENPTFLTLHPNSAYLYAVNLIESGCVRSYSIDEESEELTALNSTLSGGSDPCYCSIDASGSYIFIANASSGSVSMLPIADDGRVLKPTDIVNHKGSSIDPNRQTEPFPHSITPGPDNRYVYVPDLGTDEIGIYTLNHDSGTLSPADTANTAIHPGAGPRHIDFHPNSQWAYLINEIDSTMTVLERDPETGGLTVLETVSTVPSEAEGDSYGADIHVHPSGEWVYASNRGHDTIVQFDIDVKDGHPELMGYVSDRIEWPRNFALSPSGAHLYVECRHSDSIIAFDVDSDTGTLTNPNHIAEVPEPSCLQFFSPDHTV